MTQPRTIFRVVADESVTFERLHVSSIIVVCYSFHLPAQESTLPPTTTPDINGNRNGDTDLGKRYTHAILPSVVDFLAFYDFRSAFENFSFNTEVNSLRTVHTCTESVLLVYKLNCGGCNPRDKRRLIWETKQWVVLFGLPRYYMVELFEC